MLKDGIPQRRCIGCMNSKDQNLLLRMVLKDGRITPDEKGSQEGRGFYICKNMDCYDLAIKKKAFQRAVKGPVSPHDLESLGRWIMK